jgi:hypothetical protein
MPIVKLKSKLEVTNSDPPWHILRFPKKKVEHFGFKGNIRRVVCTLNGVETFNCSLFPAKDDYFITLNKKLRERLGLAVGDGMPMPKEFAEVLRQDAEGKRLFDALSPGNQRLMLKLIALVKDVDKRIIRSLTGIELLKRSDGAFNYHEQHDGMRAATDLAKISRS